MSTTTTSFEDTFHVYSLAEGWTLKYIADSEDASSSSSSSSSNNSSYNKDWYYYSSASDDPEDALNLAYKNFGSNKSLLILRSDLSDVFSTIEHRDVDNADNTKFVVVEPDSKGNIPDAKDGYHRTLVINHYNSKAKQITNFRFSPYLKDLLAHNYTQVGAFPDGKFYTTIAIPRAGESKSDYNSIPKEFGDHKDNIEPDYTILTVSFLLAFGLVFFIWYKNK